MSIKLCLNVGIDKCIILCNFSGPIMRGFVVIYGSLPSTPSQEAKKLCLNRVTTDYKFIFYTNSMHHKLSQHIKTEREEQEKEKAHTVQRDL